MKSASFLLLVALIALCVTNLNAYPVDSELESVHQKSKGAHLVTRAATDEAAIEPPKEDAVKDVTNVPSPKTKEAEIKQSAEDKNGSDNQNKDVEEVASEEAEEEESKSDKTANGDKAEGS
jgi:ABC-type uncharacterized transport system involved in gliding motility auxiliary subunit